MNSVNGTTTLTQDTNGSESNDGTHKPLYAIDANVVGNETANCHGG